MSFINSLVLLFLRANLGTTYQLKNSADLNVLSSIPVQSGHLKPLNIHIVESQVGNCDKIRKVVSLYSLPLSDQEIEWLGSGSTINIGAERTDDIHQIFVKISQQIGLSYQTYPLKGNPGDIHFIPSKNIGFLPDKKANLQLAMQKKSLKGSNLKSNSLIADSSLIGFEWNTTRWTCIVYINPDNGFLNYIVQ